MTYPPRPARKHASPEADFQQAVVVYLKYALPPEWRFRGSLEGALRSVQAGAKAKALGMRKGWPDIELKHRQTGQVVWIELKSATGSLLPEQREFRDECQNAEPPVTWALARTLEEVERALISFGILPTCAIEKANRYSLDDVPR